MGFVGLLEFQSLYQEIKRQAIQSPLSTVLILVSNDIDALCSLKILTMLLKADCIVHETIPVCGYTELVNLSSSLGDRFALKNIIMLNCGAVVDISELFNVKEDIRVHVIDSHRPVSLSNAFGAVNVTILDDGHLDSLVDVQKAFESVEFDDSDDDEEDDNEEEEEEEEDNDDDESNQSDNDSIHSNNVQSTAKRKKMKMSEKDTDSLEQKDDRIQQKLKRRRKRDQQRIVAEYYSQGSSYGTPASTLLYNMSSQLGRTDNDFLWMGILGLTEQYLHHKISFTQYESSIIKFKDEVSRFNPIPIDSNEFSDIEAETPEEIAIASKPINPDDRSISFHEDLHLMLLKHWTLYDSLFHSSYVAARMGIWKEKGRQRLINLIANSGLPLEQCHQTYHTMKSRFKHDITPKLKKWAPKYDLPEIFYPSFFRNYGYRLTLSASDAVHALGALMDNGHEWLVKHNSFTGGTEYNQADSLNSGFSRKLTGIGSGTRTGMASIHVDPLFLDLEPVDSDDTRKQWTRNFYVAYDALQSSGNSYSLTFILQTLVKTGISIIERRLIQSYPTFRFACLSDASSSTSQPGGLIGSSNYSLFSRSIPLLERLSRFVVDAYKTYRKDKRLPLVLAILNEKQSGYMIIGTNGTSRSTGSRGNPFGLVFQSTAEAVGAVVRHDSFETSVMEIRKQDLTLFIEKLRTLI